MADSTLSDLLGYACIGCWLGAQFPQVLENIRRRSCEGLALPFLANWLLGDISNLVGCILTHQLPFQTWLATYFVLVDFTLVGQYFYYQRFQPPAPSRLRFSRRIGTDRNTPRYRTLSAVAANVAAAAALVANQEEHSEYPHSSHWPHSSRDLRRANSGSRVSGFHDSEDGEEGNYGGMADSYHSEGGQHLRRSLDRPGLRGGSMGRYPPARSAILPPFRTSQGDPPAESATRGRPLLRDAEGAPSDLEPAIASAHRKTSMASRKSSTMVFLGFFVLFTVTSFGGRVPGVPSRLHSTSGRVLTPRMDAYASHLNPWIGKTVHPSFPSIILRDSKEPHPPHDGPHETPTNERVIGRIFAWLCTTLYLTSRLPQIWKNYVRKSVEGLSMYLFLFAFLGNSFYVASILASPSFDAPPPISTEFIRESIPYLLGSGGTLMFDVTILTQSYIYRPKPKRQRNRQAEEEAGLLSNEPAYSSGLPGPRERTPSTVLA